MSASGGGAEGAAPPLTGVLETALYVADVDRAAGFYQRLFGSRVLLDEPGRMRALDRCRHRSTLAVRPCTSGVSARSSMASPDCRAAANMSSGTAPSVRARSCPT